MSKRSATVPPSEHFVRRDGQLHADGVALEAIADQVGTPAYVYSGAAIDRAYASIHASLAEVPHQVCYAVKANSNGAVLRRLAAVGCGADIVSGGELQRALRAGFPPSRIVFSGVGKTAEEIEAALRAGILSINVESQGELRTIARIAEGLGAPANIALRVNPDVDAQTHPYISTGLHGNKFGLELSEARQVLPYVVDNPHLRLEGLACHIGSMVLSPEPLAEALHLTAAFARECLAAGAPIKRVDAGGGWPILYGDEAEARKSDAVFGRALIDAMAKAGVADLDLTLLIEPGRSIVGDAGVMLTRVLYVKEQAGKRFIIVDGAMSELIRPALYGAYHAVELATAPAEGAPLSPADVVGPVCESADFLAKDRALPQVAPGDLLVVRGAGAYGAVMASNYNSRPMAPEIMVDGTAFTTIRRRQTLSDILDLESE